MPQHPAVSSVRSPEEDAQYDAGWSAYYQGLPDDPTRPDAWRRGWRAARG